MKKVLTILLMMVMLFSISVPATISVYANTRACTTCSGAGGRHCNTCDGRGFVPGTTRRCPNTSCSSGWVRCTFCSGSGRIPDSGSSGGNSGGGSGGSSGMPNAPLPETPELTTEQLGVADYLGHPGVPNFGVFSGAEFIDDFSRDNPDFPYRRSYQNGSQTLFYQYLKLLESKGFHRFRTNYATEYNRISYTYALNDNRIEINFFTNTLNLIIWFNALPQTNTQPPTPAPVTPTPPPATPTPTPTPSTPIAPSTSGSTVIEIIIDNPVAKVNGANVTLDQPATVLNGRTVVPARFIAESLGATVNWNGELQVVTIMKLPTILGFVIDSTRATLNDGFVELEQSAVILNGRTMVPARFIAENLGATVEWDEFTRKVTIRQ